MATVTGDPRFSGFDAAAFRTAIENTMTMGLPNTVSERITFRWTTVRTMAATDAYDFTATPDDTDAPADVLIPAAVEFTTRASLGEQGSIASIESPRVVVTITDTYFPDITSSGGRRADRMVLGGDIYKVDFVAPPIGLFDVTVYQVHGTAIDES